MLADALVVLALAAGPDFDVIVAGVGDRPHAESCAAMTTWAADHAADPRARRGRVWCGRLLWIDGSLGDARVVLERVVAERTDDDPAMQALSTLGELEFAQGRFAQATADYRALAASGVELWRYSGTQALIEVERARHVWWQALAASVLLFGALAWRAAAVRRALWPAPAEVLVLAPLLVLLGALACTQPPMIARALGTLVLGGATAAWLNGAWWRLRPPAGSRRILEALGGAGQGLLLLDVVLVSSGLWRPLWQSMTEGFP